jgi:N-methylhydantoinase A
MLLSPAQIDAKFRRAYEDEFGFDLPMAAVQLVSLHMTSVTARSSSQIPLGVSDVQNEPRQPLAYRSARILGPDNKVTNIPVYKSESLITTHNSNCNSICIEGPLLVDHWGSTVLIDQGQTLSTLPGGGIVFTI